jgi:hypothetical protein
VVLGLIYSYVVKAVTLNPAGYLMISYSIFQAHKFPEWWTKRNGGLPAGVQAGRETRRELMVQKKTGSAGYSIWRLLEPDSHADIGVFEHVFALDSDHFAAFNAGKLPFFLCQSDCAWEIDFHDVAGPNRSGDGNRDKNTCLANVCASAVKKSVSFRQPKTYGPRKSSSSMLTLLG